MLQIKSNTTSLLAAMVFDHASLNITFPILTLIFFDIHSNLFAPSVSLSERSIWYGLCISLPHIVNIIISPLLSAASDVWGRRKILIIGMLGAFVYAFLGGLAVYYGCMGLLLSALLIRGAFSRTNPIAQAAIGDISNDTNKVQNMGYLQTSISLGAFIGPLLGGWFASAFFITLFNFSFPFIVSAFFALISLYIICKYFKETLYTPHLPSTTPLTFAAIKNFLLTARIISISLILLLTQISWSLYYQFIPPILKTYLNFNADALGYFVGFIAFWLAITTAFSIRFLKKFFTLPQLLIFSLYLVLIGIILSLVGIFCDFRYSNVLIWFSAFPTAAGDVIAYSCLVTLYSDSVQHSQQGKIMAVCALIVALVWSSTGLIGGCLMSCYPLLSLLFAPIGIVVALVLLKYFQHSRCDPISFLTAP